MTTRSGFVAVVGRPNVGKSTLINHIIGQKLAITSRKPQTTRHRMLGIKTEGDDQMIFVDTPGIHAGGKKAINRYMNREATNALQDVDVVVFVVDRHRFTEEDQMVFDRIKEVNVPVILAVNKVDRIQDKPALIEHMAEMSGRHSFAQIVPISAINSTNVAELEEEIKKLLPESEHHYGEDEITDKSYKFLCAEIVREKIMRQLGEELPYQMTVAIEEFAMEPDLATVSALILVERDSQKAIVIGQRGSRLKKIGQEARIDMERLFDSKVMLNLWVKVKSGWSDDDRALRSLGYGDTE